MAHTNHLTESACVQAEPDIFGSTGSDRSIALYDLRHNTPIRKIVMQTNANALCWNPMEPLNFVVASEDCNLYTYDMRKLDTATCVHEVRPPYGSNPSAAAPVQTGLQAGRTMPHAARRVCR